MPLAISAFWKDFPSLPAPVASAFPLLHLLKGQKPFDLSAKPPGPYSFWLALFP